MLGEHLSGALKNNDHRVEGHVPMLPHSASSYQAPDEPSHILVAP
jgi:hypothetical protein